MSNLDWLLGSTAPISVAAAAAGLQGDEKKRVDGLQWVVAQHKRLMALEDNDAQDQFRKLDRKTQDALKNMFGDTDYAAEETSIFGSAKKYISEKVGGGLDTLVEVSDTVNPFGQTFRAFSILDEAGSFSEAWKRADDGNRLFDADREERVDKFYGPAVSKIAKRLSMGDTLGEILVDISTDEEFKAVERLLNGDQEFINAMRDYDQAKLSIGRSFAHMFGLDPNVGETQQGAEGLTFKMISGSVDLATTVLGDPTTYAWGAITASRKGMYGIMQLLRAQEGSLSNAQKALKAIGREPSFDNAFKNENVRNAFDRVGEQVAIAADKSLNKAETSLARVRIKEIFPTFDDNMIDVLVKENITDADKALQFFKSGNAVERILVGKVGSEEAMLPFNATRNRFRNGLGAITNKVIGYDTRSEFDDLVTEGGLDRLLSAASADEAGQIKQFNRRRQNFEKLLDKALIEQSVYTGGIDKLGRSMKVKSAGTVYTLARTVFDKKTARAMSQMYVTLGDDQSRNLVKGLYYTIGDRYGLRSTQELRESFDDIVNKTFNGTYSEIQVVDEAMSQITGLPVGSTYNAGEVGGKQVATAIPQTSDQMMLPSMREIESLRIRSTTAHGELSKNLRGINQIVTDFWSALNLLPRLGLRSVLDEGLFNFLTVPGAVAQNAVRGYFAGQAQRILAGTGTRKDVGFVSRHVFSKIITKDVDQQSLVRAARDKVFAAELLEQQLIKGAVGRLIFNGPDGKEYARYVADMVKYGQINHMRGLSENMAKSYSVSTPASALYESAYDVSDSLRRAAKQADLELHGGVPTELPRSGTNDMLFNVNMMHQLIHRIDLNGEIGQIVARNVDNLDSVSAAQKSVEEIKKILVDKDGAPTEVYRRFERLSLDATNLDKDAADMFIHARSVLLNSKGEVNKPLLAKMRKDNGKYVAADLEMQDIIELGNDLPLRVLGYMKKVEAFADFPTAVSRGVNKLFGVMDRQVATLSREPSVYMWTLYNRKQLAPLEAKRVKDLVAGGMPEELAKESAASWATSIASELSLNRVIGFIDNPHVRSNLAFGVRNVARYYRATEDFYRRAGRAMSPRALIRLRLAAEGLENSGFIHEDENGEKFFVFPVDDITFNAYAAVANRVMGQQIYKPMPLSITGKIKMLTPSLDPSSNVPSLAGPLAALTWQGIKTFMPEELLREEDKPKVQKLLFGNFAEGQSFWDQVTPVSLRRVGNAIDALSGDMKNEQLASAFMKSLAMYAANGYAPKDGATPSEIDQYLYDVKVSSRNVVFIRSILGLFSPVAPQVAELQDIRPELLDIGITSFRSEFRDMVDKEYKSGNRDAWNTALVKWTKINPGRLVYTVSETETDAVAPIKKTKESVLWLQRNENLAKKYRTASVFLMPQVDGFDMEAYMFLKREGYQKRKDLDKYFEEVFTVVAANEHDTMKKEYEERIAYADTPEQVSMLRAEMDQAVKQFTNTRPNLKRMFEQTDGTTQLKKSVVEDMRRMLGSGDVPESETTAKLRRLVTEFDRLYGAVNSITATDDFASEQKRNLKVLAVQRLEEIAGTDPNAIAFYENILKRLLD